MVWQAFVRVPRIHNVSELSFITAEVRRHGHAERSWTMLVNGYFRGQDWAEQIEAWARENDLTVSFNSEHRSCLFRGTRATPSK